MIFAVFDVLLAVNMIVYKLVPRNSFFSSGAAFYLSPLAVQKVTTPLLLFPRID